VDIDRPAGRVWAYVADYGNDPSWRAAITQMRPSQPGPAREGVTTHELLRLLGMTFAATPPSTGSTAGHRRPGSAQAPAGDVDRQWVASEEPTT
jgi:hypothetical protein